MPNLKLHKDKEGEFTIVEGEDSLVAQLMKGCKGNINLNIPFNGGEVKKLKDSKGKILRDKDHPEKVGKVEKPKKDK